MKKVRAHLLIVKEEQKIIVNRSQRCEFLEKDQSVLEILLDMPLIEKANILSSYSRLSFSGTIFPKQNVRERHIASQLLQTSENRNDDKILL